jgi:diadenosine tetraphosphate (Ap4A) HIT family hydrolase
MFHAHWHLIPRREGDYEQPRSGVRGGGDSVEMALLNTRSPTSATKRQTLAETVRSYWWVNHK